MYSILVCDDEKDIVSALKIYLMADGYQVFEAYNGKEVLEVLKSHDIHLVLMDIMMPEMDGISAMVKIRETSNVPVILLTAKSEDTDKVLGLTVGADDYITKPFNPVEVQARVKSQLRRYMQLGGGAIRKDVLSIGGIELDDRSKEVSHGIRYFKTSDGASRRGVFPESDLRAGMAGQSIRNREYRSSTYQTSAGKSRI